MQDGGKEAELDTAEIQQLAYMDTSVGEQIEA